MSAAEIDSRELFVRHARKDDRSVVFLRAVDYGDSCVVEAEVYPMRNGNVESEPLHPGPYTFPDAQQATTLRHRGGRGADDPRLRRAGPVARLRRLVFLDTSVRTHPHAAQAAGSRREEVCVPGTQAILGVRRASGQTRTRASSSIDVRPPATLASPSSQSERMPPSIAARSTSSRLARATASCAIVSFIVSSW